MRRGDEVGAAASTGRLASLVPPGIVIAEDGALGAHAPGRSPGPGDLLPPEELRLVAGASERRRRDFVAGRRCAHDALRSLGHHDAVILAGAGRDPLWPAGIVGSITHCDGYAAAAVAPVSVVAGIGIDAEPLAPLDGSLRRMILAPGEEPARVGGDIDPVLLAFSAKEAAFKAWYPLMHRWLEQRDVAVHVEGSHFVVTVLVASPPGSPAAPVLEGRWAVTPGHVLCAATVPPALPGRPPGSGGSERP